MSVVYEVGVTGPFGLKKLMNFVEIYSISLANIQRCFNIFSGLI